MNWIDYIRDNSFNIIYALTILLGGITLAQISKRWLRNKIRLKSKDPTVKLFIVNAGYAGIILMVTISALTRLGVPTASMLTVLGAGSLAIALSLKDSLSHVASGLILISLKPFHIGDVVDINGIIGTLDQINLLNIRIKCANGDYVVIPNSKVFSDKIRTKGKNGERRIELDIGISYDANIKTAKTIIQHILSADQRILKNPAPIIAVKTLADSAVTLTIRPWVKNKNYTTVLFDLTEAIKLAFDENSIGIPYPQMEAYIHHVHNPQPQAEKPAVVSDWQKVEQ